jgi:cation transport ATPase
MTKRRPTNLPRWQELAVYVSFGLLLITGIAWLIFDTWVRVPGDFGPEHHPAEHWMLIVHAIGAYAFLVILGAMIPVHIPLGWHQRRNLKSGISLLTIFGLLGLTALGLYYIGDDALRSWTSLIHWAVGLIALPALLIHALRRVTPQRAESPRRRDRPKPGG